MLLSQRVLFISILWFTLPELQCTTPHVHCIGYATPQVNVASYKLSGIRLSLQDTTTLLVEGGGRKELVHLQCLEKCSPSMQFSQ